MQANRDITEQDVINYLHTIVPDDLIVDNLTNKLEVFGNMNAREFASKTSWRDVLGIFKRIYE